MAQTGAGQAEAVVHLLPLLVDDVHPVGGVLLPAHRTGGRGVRVVEALLALPQALLYLHGLSVLVVVHDEDVLALNVHGLLGVHSGLPVVTGSRLLHKGRSGEEISRDPGLVIKYGVLNKLGSYDIVKNLDGTGVVLYFSFTKCFPIGTWQNWLGSN